VVVRVWAGVTKSESLWTSARLRLLRGRCSLVLVSSCYQGRC
jgi:hypothetical protein